MQTWRFLHDSQGRVTMVFNGHLTADDGVASAARFADALRDAPRDVVWDVRGMTGYDSRARVAWQDALWPFRRNIRSISVVGGNTLVRFGARAMSIALGVPCSFAETVDVAQP